MADAIGCIAGPRKLDKTLFREALLEGLGTLNRLSLEGLLLFVYPNLLSSGLIYHLEGGGEVFVEFFGFLFNNTSRCYLVFASFFPYSYALCLLFVVHVYAQV